ncbi:MAG: helix-turn-helix domain-containing protein [Myxococcales bacterium]
MSDPATVLLLERLLTEVQGLRAAIESRAAPPAAAEPAAELLDVKGAAGYCGNLSASTIYRAAERGELRCLRAGARLRFTRADLDAWMRGERPTQGAVVALRTRS